jgi:phosphoglycerol transferase MdoB-like AlkP superfamily enzyme
MSKEAFANGYRLIMQRANRRGLSYGLWTCAALIGINLGFFSLLRIAFLYWNWAQFQTLGLTEIFRGFLVGLRFDFSAVLMVMSPWLLFSLFLIDGTWGRRAAEKLFSRGSFVIFILLTLPLWVLNIIDLEFVNFVGRRFTAGSLFIFREFRGGGAQSFIAPYWHWILLELIVLYFFYRLQWGCWRRRNEATHWIGLNFVILMMAVIGVRGGLQKKPLSFVHANIFVTPLQNNLVLNSSFTILKSLKKETLGRESFFQDQSQMKNLLNGYSPGPSSLEDHRPWLVAGDRPSKPNIVILILESFGAEYLGAPINQGSGFTPFLDKMVTDGQEQGTLLFFDRAFANGRRSIEGIAAIYAGIPSMMDEPFISSEFSSNYFVGLGSLLGQAGYHTSFFHGADNGTMYFDSFMKSAGVQNYFGAKDYPKAGDHDGAWGIYDEPFLNFFGEKLSTFEQPFFAGLFTLSSHAPYVIPEKYRARFPKGPLEISASIAYTDYAVSEFFKMAQKQSWFKDTIFILTADHTQKNYRPEYNHIQGLYQVPLIFYAPGFVWPKVNNHQLAQHIDLLPTIVDILDIRVESSILLGRSLFVPGEKTISNFLEPGFLAISEDYFLLWNRPQAPVLFSQKDPQQKNPVVDQMAIQTHLENRLKASLQYFSQGLWDQKLYFPSR